MKINILLISHYICPEPVSFNVAKHCYYRAESTDQMLHNPTPIRAKPLALGP